MHGHPCLCVLGMKPGAEHASKHSDLSDTPAPHRRLHQAAMTRAAPRLCEGKQSQETLQCQSGKEGGKTTRAEGEALVPSIRFCLPGSGEMAPVSVHSRPA